MPEWLTSLRIGLSLTGVTALRVGQWRKPRVHLLKDMQFASEAKSQAQLQERLVVALADLQEGGKARVRARAAHVVLADEWVRYFTVTPPGNVGRLADLQDVAALRFQDLYELSPADWHIQAAWSATRPFLACAMPLWLRATLEHAAASHALRLDSIEPQFTSAWNQWGAKARPDGWFGVLHKRRLSCSALQAGYPAENHAIVLPEQALQDPFWIGEQLKRTALMRGITPPQALHLCGVRPGPWMSSAGSQFQVIALEPPEPDATLATDGVALALQGYPR